MSESKRLVRPKKGRMLGGVCAAIANYFSIDVTIIRLIAVILLFPGWLPGFLPYIICWIVIPEEQI